jgi:hypothetical protein
MAEHQQARAKVSFTPYGCGIDGILMRVAVIVFHDNRIMRNAIGLVGSFQSGPMDSTFQE